jgi:hypothetical protein
MPDAPATPDFFRPRFAEMIDLQQKGAFQRTTHCTTRTCGSASTHDQGRMRVVDLKGKIARNRINSHKKYDNPLTVQ